MINLTEANSKKKMKRKLVFHPFLIAIFLVLSPLAQNLGTIGLEAVRALIIVPMSVILVTILLKLILRQKRKAGIITTAGLLFIGTYGHVAELLGSLIAMTKPAEVVLLIIWVGLALLVGIGIFRRMNDPDPWHLYLNVVGVILLVFPLINIVTYSRNSPVVEERSLSYQAELFNEYGLSDVEASWLENEDPRDIYYIVLDGYARADVLAELYEYDNSPFIEALEARGFYIPSEAEANYESTIFSLASTLNLAFVNEAPLILETEIVSDSNALLKDGLSQLIAENFLAGFYRDQGYEIVSFDSGYGGAQIAGADEIARSPEVSDINAEAAFELMLMDTSIGRFLLKMRGEDFTPLQSLFEEHRHRVQYGIKHLSDYADRPGRQFIFSHVISPHYPYVFGPNGEPRYGVEPFSLLDQPGLGDWDPGLYRDQVIYVNSLVLAEVDQILAKSEPDPIILIHADHGSRSWADPEPSASIQRQLLFPILTAMYLPGGDSSSEAYPDISPVNLNRLILNRYFDAGLEMLPDESYLLIGEGNSRQFVEACQVLEGCSGSGD